VFCEILCENNVCIDSFKDHNHLQISEPIINQQKLNNLKSKALDVIYVWIKNIQVSRHIQKYTQAAIYMKKKMKWDPIYSDPTI